MNREPEADGSNFVGFPGSLTMLGFQGTRGAPGIGMAVSGRKKELLPELRRHFHMPTDRPERYPISFHNVTS
jgi:hypothetical protein